jgi:hypothetical protein
MAIFDQRNQTVKGNQYNAETINFTISQDNIDFVNQIKTLKRVDSNINKKLKDLLNFLKSGNIEETLHILQDMEEIQNSDMYKSVLLLNARLGRINKSKIEEVIDRSEYNLEVNKIIRSTLEIIDLIEK